MKVTRDVRNFRQRLKTVLFSAHYKNSHIASVLAFCMSVDTKIIENLVLEQEILLTILWSRLGKRIGDQGIVYKIGPGNRHWGAFAEKCINNRTVQHDTTWAEPIVYCFRRMHLKGSKSHAVYSIPLFLSQMERLFGDDVKSSCLALS